MQTRKRHYLAPSFLVLFFLAPTVSRTFAEPPATRPSVKPEFIRVTESGSAGGKLETSIVTYVSDKGQVVRLISAVHIGEAEYYTQLNKAFEKDDVVLYEMVKPKDAVMPAPGTAGASASMIAQMQRMMKDVLNLDYQLDIIDYTRPNFVHADLDAEVFEKMQADRGESMMTMMFQQFQAAMKDMGNNPPAADDMAETLKDVVKMISRPDGERQIKLRLARQFADVDRLSAGLDGPDGSVIITERNKVALKTLDKVLADGKKNASIFYGAAHMPDMDKHLTERGFRPIATEWLTAWDMTIRADQPSTIEKTLTDLIDAIDQIAN